MSKFLCFSVLNKQKGKEHERLGVRDFGGGLCASSTHMVLAGNLSRGHICEELWEIQSTKLPVSALSGHSFRYILEITTVYMKRDHF